MDAVNNMNSGGGKNTAVSSHADGTSVELDLFLLGRDTRFIENEGLRSRSSVFLA